MAERRMSPQACAAGLRAIAGAGLELEVPLAERTSWRIGGPAQYFVQPEDEAAVVELWRFCHSHQVPLTLLGGGTNVLIADAGIRGVVMDLVRGFSFLRAAHPSTGSGRAGAGRIVPSVHESWHVGAGFGTGRLVRRAVSQGLAGAEVLAGVPGSLGGALVMNAGGHEGELASIVQRVRVVKDGEATWMSRTQMGFGYRKSSLNRDAIVLGATLILVPGDKAELQKKVRDSQARRRRSQPLTQPNAGSVFKNPPGHSAAAGRLIEEAGCKGWREGGAVVSARHANFIVNEGGAKAADVLRLSERVRARVRSHAGVELEFEVKLLGEFHG